MPKRPLGCAIPGCVASSGNQHYTAANPPFGAMFTYYLPEELRSQKDQRLEREKELNEAGRDIGFPGWDKVLAESAEDEPAMILTVSDAGGNVVSHIAGPVEAGFHRVAWNLRYPSPDAYDPDPDPEPWEPPGGTLAIPGTYSVTLSRRIDGVVQPTGESQRFEVVSARNATLVDSSQGERVDYLRQIDALDREVDSSVAAIDELLEQTKAMKQMLLASIADPRLYGEAHALEKSAKDLRDKLTGNREREMMSEPGIVSVSQRLYVAGWGDRTQAFGPTDHQRENFEIAQDDYAEIRKALQQMFHVDLPDLQRRLDEAGVPWTPGRSIPAR